MISARAGLKTVLYRWNYEHKPHFVTDSAIGGFSILEEIKDQSYLTSSISKKDHPWIWCLLNRKLNPDSWRYIINPSGFIISVKNGSTQDGSTSSSNTTYWFSWSIFKIFPSKKDTDSIECIMRWNEYIYKI